MKNEFFNTLTIGSTGILPHTDAQPNPPSATKTQSPVTGATVNTKGQMNQNNKHVDGAEVNDKYNAGEPGSVTTDQTTKSTNAKTVDGLTDMNKNLNDNALKRAKQVNDQTAAQNKANEEAQGKALQDNSCAGV